MVALLALIVLSPVLLIVAILVRVKCGSPVLFVQERPGLRGKPFKMIKFRSMTNEKGPDGELLDDELRLHRFGKILRSTSLDELPELINVLIGEMSLVGPRPLLMSYLEKYTPEQMRRHDVRPGITGWAQVNGRNAVDWEDRLRKDVWYVDNRSFFLDLKILWMTVLTVVMRDGVSAKGHATMPRFIGQDRAASAAVVSVSGPAVGILPESSGDLTKLGKETIPHKKKRSEALAANETGEANSKADASEV